MVSFWPFGREDASSPRSFEKTLATLSDKIRRLQVRGDTLSATHRRVKVLFTLYSLFAYILVVLILTLVTGYQKWHAAEWAAIIASPFGIFAIRYLLDLYFDWRETNVRTRLDKATKERDKVIKKLKDAMRYDSTKELLDKYGGMDAKKEAQRQAKKVNDKPQQVQRTGLPPPPTANVAGRTPLPANVVAPQHSVSGTQSTSLQPSESFAPNAFDSPQKSIEYKAQVAANRPGFLDRMLDLLVGEDESAARNRIVLICSNCRTVNGQAPPGTRSLADVGKWRCGTCHAWNGEDSETDRALKAAGLSAASPTASEPADDTSPIDHERSIDEGAHDNDAMTTSSETISNPAASTRSRTRQSLKT